MHGPGRPASRPCLLPVQQGALASSLTSTHAQWPSNHTPRTKYTPTLPLQHERTLCDPASPASVQFCQKLAVQTCAGPSTVSRRELASDHYQPWRNHGAWDAAASPCPPAGRGRCPSRPSPPASRCTTARAARHIPLPNNQTRIAHNKQKAIYNNSLVDVSGGAALTSSVAVHVPLDTCHRRTAVSLSLPLARARPSGFQAKLKTQPV